MKAYLKYIWYILRHKWYVFLECVKLGIIWRGIIHDWHKLLPSEFFPYAKYFYMDWPKWIVLKHISPNFPYKDTEEGVKEQFNLAWLLHQKRAPHHWQFWILRKDDGTYKTFPMPDVFRKEMLADWRGAGRAINGVDETKGWYIKNRDKMELHPQTRELIEKELF